MKQTKLLLPLLLVFAFIYFLPLGAAAQLPEDPGGEPVPLDGGIGIMIAAGVGYGLKKVKNQKQTMSTKEKGLP